MKLLHFTEKEIIYTRIKHVINDKICLNNSAMCVQLTLITVKDSSDQRTFFYMKDNFSSKFFRKYISPKRHFVPKTKSPGYFVTGHFGRIPPIVLHILEDFLQL